MKVSQQLIYHLYNQGNNRQKIFYSPRNYLFFLSKVKLHLLPSASILAYCLMPNHFHFLIRPTAFGVEPSESRAPNTSQVENRPETILSNFSRSLQSMLSSYTRGLNREEKRTGSLFRQNTKLKRVYDFQTGEGLGYLQTSFDYLHLNPVEAGLVTDQLEWPYSSALEYAGMIEEGFCDHQVLEELLGFSKPPFQL